MQVVAHKIVNRRIRGELAAPLLASPCLNASNQGARYTLPSRGGPDENALEKRHRRGLAAIDIVPAQRSFGKAER